MEPVSEPPVWRSMLYVPSHMERFVNKAASRGADAIILDLEDSVPEQERPAARAGLASAVATVGAGGADVLVRINRPLKEAVADIAASVLPGVCAFMLPKIESAQHLQLLEEVVEETERANGLPVGAIGFIPMIETAGAYFRVEEIARASSRNIAMTLGGEDFALDTGMVPDGETLFLASQKVVYAARAAGILPLGTIGTVADYQDLEAYRESAIKSRKFGFEGSSCIHPSVVPVLNEEFAPTDEEVAAAERIISAYAEAQAKGKGAIQLDGKMVDVPVAIRAENLLRRHRAIQAKCR
jgi:citrate lyase subunit beta / citryl-CoA lyase